MGAIAAGLGGSPSVSKSKTSPFKDARGKTDSANLGETMVGGRQTPLLAPKSKIADEARKQGGKGKGETVGASSIATRAGLHKVSPTPKSKSSEAETRKQNGQDKVDSASVDKTAGGGQQKPSPAAKTPGVEVKKQNGQDKLDSAAGDDKRAAPRSSRQVIPTRKSYQL